MTYSWVQGTYFRGSLVERKSGIRLIVTPKYSIERSGEVWEWCCETQGTAETEDAAQKAAERAADAYRRGAEAMREQAAMVDPYGLHLDRAEFARVISGPASIVQIIRAGIRALPIPEDT